MENHGHHEDLRRLMERRVQAILAAPAFMQQIKPWTGAARGGCADA